MRPSTSRTNIGQVVYVWTASLVRYVVNSVHIPARGDSQVDAAAGEVTAITIVG